MRQKCTRLLDERVRPSIGRTFLFVDKETGQPFVVIPPSRVDIFGVLSERLTVRDGRARANGLGRFMFARQR